MRAILLTLRIKQFSVQSAIERWFYELSSHIEYHFLIIQILTKMDKTT